MLPTASSSATIACSYECTRDRRTNRRTGSAQVESPASTRALTDAPSARELYGSTTCGPKAHSLRYRGLVDFVSKRAPCSSNVAPRLQDPHHAKSSPPRRGHPGRSRPPHQRAPRRARERSRHRGSPALAAARGRHRPELVDVRVRQRIRIRGGHCRGDQQCGQALELDRLACRTPFASRPSGSTSGGATGWAGSGGVASVCSRRRRNTGLLSRIRRPIGIDAGVRSVRLKDASGVCPCPPAVRQAQSRFRTRMPRPLSPPFPPLNCRASAPQVSRLHSDNKPTLRNRTAAGPAHLRPQTIETS
jgi:hypothetical protein